MTGIESIGFAAAFLAGVVSFLSPCVLPLVPGYISYIAGKSLEEVKDGANARSRLEVMWLSMNFVVGFSMVFIALGATATFFGQALLSYRYEAGLVAGVVIFVFGIHMMGLLRFGWFNREWRVQGKLANGTPLGAMGLGMAFAFGWTPCIGPILGAILTMSASTADVQQGVALLAIYSLGLAIPFLVVAAFMGTVIGRMKWLGRSGRVLHVASGGVLALVGVAMMTGTLNTAGTWLLNTFPIMQELVI
jgi:cytochrome c-type biogenesis protein